MITEPQKEILRKHYKIFVMVHDHDYLPGGYHNEVQELNRLHKEIHGAEKDINCGSCIRGLFDALYIPFEGQGGTTLFHKEPEILKPVKNGKKR
jgi:hypothetical protein